MNTGYRLRWTAWLCVIPMVLGTVPAAMAGDEDDGIKADDPIDDELKEDKNFSFVVVNAKGKSKSGASDGKAKSDGVGNINIGANANLKGATIINVSKNKNNNVVSEDK